MITRLVQLGCGFLLVAQLGAQTPAPPNVPPPASTPAPIAARYAPPAYPVPYEPASVEQISAVLNRVRGYLETASPVSVIDRDTGQPVADLAHLPANPAFVRTDFLLISYEWGVTYSGMLLAADVTGDGRFRDYVSTRLGAVAAVAKRQRERPATATDEAPGFARALALRPVLNPRSLDDSGSMAAAMIKATRAGVQAEALRPWIDNYLQWITTGQYRFPDGTLARHRPLANTLWLDDLYMSVPALAQMGVLTGDRRYFDDAVRQVTQFGARMFVRERGLFLHGWVQDMEPHPAFHWARANGWAVVAMAELLSVLPEDHPGRVAVLELYRAHARSLAALQDYTGLWHQLLDRNDTYLETSCTAMFVYGYAHAINQGWISSSTYGSIAQAGWVGLSTRINAKGQVDGTCVGTTFASDPIYYYNRPANVYALHGYGPTLLAGAEMIKLLKNPAIDIQIKLRTYHYVPKASGTPSYREHE